MITDFLNNYKKFLIPLASLLVMALLGLAAYRVLVFQVLSADPANNSTVSNDSRLITITYNKELSPVDKSKQLITSSDIVSSFRTDGSKLLIQLKGVEANKKYVINLIDITATDGSKIDQYDYSFTYSYSSFDSLSSKEKKSQIASTDKGNIDSPVIKNLPITTSSFYISYELHDQPDSKGKHEKVIVALLLSDPELTDGNKVRQYKQQAIKFLNSKGISLKDYTVEFVPDAVNNY